MLKGRTLEDSDADLRRCSDVVAMLAAGKYDAIAGRYLDIAWDLDRPDSFSSAASSTPQLPPPTHQD